MIFQQSEQKSQDFHYFLNKVMTFHLVVQGYVEMFNGMANFSWDFNTPSYYFSVIDLMELDNEINNIC